VKTIKAHWKDFVAHLRRHRNASGRYCIALALASLLCAAPTAAQLPLPELSHELTRLSTPIEAPDFQLEDMDGNKHSLENYRGKVVILNFWATWCPPCRREIPSMEALHRAFKEEAFAILAVNEWETEDHVFAFMGQLPVDPGFPILFDLDSAVATSFGVKGLPTTLLLDTQGKIVYRAVGGRDFDHPEVKKIIRELLPDAGRPHAHD
jgi:thiol-disulfide isomerase/thioredoxin